MTHTTQHCKIFHLMHTYIKHTHIKNMGVLVQLSGFKGPLKRAGENKCLINCFCWGH